jgi:MtrB/PioB family decaheme-associated outer membrane protein
MTGHATFRCTNGTGRRIRGACCRAFILLAALTGIARAEAPVFKNWDCLRCLSAEGWELDVQGGPAYVSDDAFAFGDYTGLDSQGLYLFGDIFGRYRGENSNYMTFQGYARGPDSSAFFLQGGKQSLYELRASYQAIPRRFSDATVTPYRSDGAGRLTLPQNWERAPTTGQMTTLSSTAAPVAIGRDWDIYGFGFDVNPNQRWKLRADYTRRERSGTERQSGSFVFNATELAVPVDYATDDLEAAVSYSADGWQATLTYFGSVFSNDTASLTFDNPYTAAPGVDTGQLARPPDNESHQVALAGSMLLPARTTVNGQLSIGRMSQNEPLQPYTTNALLPVNPLPVASAGAEVDTLNLNVRAVTSPWAKVTLEGELRYHEFDNQTPVNLYDYVITDTVPAPAAAASAAYDYERRDLKLRGEYRVKAGMKLFAGFDNRRFERDRQDRGRTTTNNLWFRLRTRLGRYADLDVDLFSEDRDGSTYTAVATPASPENPLMRKYNMADRQREGVRLRGSVYGGERTDFGWEVEYSEDDYDSSMIGLSESEYLRFGADFTHLFTAAASVYTSLYNEQIETDQRNSQTFSTPDWAATTDDRFVTAMMGVVYPELFGPVDASVEFTWSRSVGQIRNDTSGLPTAFPDLRSTRRNVKLGLSYPFSESLSLGFDYFFEGFDSDNWALDGVSPDTIPNLLALGANARNYNANVFYFSVRYQFQRF